MGADNAEKRGFPLLEYIICLIVILGLIVAALAALPGIRSKAQQTRKIQALKLIFDVEAAMKQYERDYNMFPPTVSSFRTGPAVFALSQPDPFQAPYMEFTEPQVMAWPLSTESDLRSPALPEERIHFRDNTLNPAMKGGPPVHLRYSVDIWTRDLKGNEFGFNNWSER